MQISAVSMNYLTYKPSFSGKGAQQLDRHQKPSGNPFADDTAANEAIVSETKYKMGLDYEEFIPLDAKRKDALKILNDKNKVKRNFDKTADHIIETAYTACNRRLALQNLNLLLNAKNKGLEQTVVRDVFDNITYVNNGGSTRSKKFVGGALTKQDIDVQVQRIFGARRDDAIKTSSGLYIYKRP